VNSLPIIQQTNQKLTTIKNPTNPQIRKINPSMLKAKQSKLPEAKQKLAAES